MAGEELSGPGRPPLPLPPARDLVDAADGPSAVEPGWRPRDLLDAIDAAAASSAADSAPSDGTGTRPAAGGEPRSEREEPDPVSEQKTPEPGSDEPELGSTQEEPESGLASEEPEPGSEEPEPGATQRPQPELGLAREEPEAGVQQEEPEPGPTQEKMELRSEGEPEPGTEQKREPEAGRDPEPDTKSESESELAPESAPDSASVPASEKPTDGDAAGRPAAPDAAPGTGADCEAPDTAQSPPADEPATGARAAAGGEASPELVAEESMQSAEETSAKSAAPAANVAEDSVSSRTRSAQNEREERPALPEEAVLEVNPTPLSTATEEPPASLEAAPEEQAAPEEPPASLEAAPEEQVAPEAAAPVKKMDASAAPAASRETVPEEASAAGDGAAEAREVAPAAQGGAGPPAAAEPGAAAGPEPASDGVRRSQPNLSAVPTRSNLKRKSTDPAAGSSAKRPRRGIQFDGVTVFYFPRAQGFTCIPSQGGSTLGMADAHSHVERFTLTDHVNEQRLAHRELLSRLRLKQRKVQPSTSSSEESDAGSEEGSDVSDSELDVDSYFFLRPVSTRQRRALLRASGVRKIEPMEKDECRNIRTSREFCGCACKVVCRPENCQCACAGIKCQVDRQNFPCGCTRDGCQNPTGRIEFNPSRVRSHFVETIMREQPPRPPAPGPAGSGAGWASCGWQKAAGCAPPAGPQYMAEQEYPSGYAAGAGGFAELATPYQDESSYSENSDGSSDSYEAAVSSAAAAPAYQPPQTQSHYSSFSFEGGLQNYGPPPAPAPPFPAALAGYQQAYPPCQSYATGAHAYPPPPHYSYPFNKYPTSGPGPGGGGGGGGGGVPGGAAGAAAVYPPGCYPTYPSAAGQPGCSYEPAPPVYATAGPFESASCTYPVAAQPGGYAGPPAAAAAAPPGAEPPEPAAPADAAAAGGDERKYTDLRSVPQPAGGQLDSLADLLQNKFGGWLGGAAAVGASYCSTPPSEDSGVEVDECTSKHPEQTDENIGEIMKKTMVESVSA